MGNAFSVAGNHIFLFLPENPGSRPTPQGMDKRIDHSFRLSPGFAYRVRRLLRRNNLLWQASHLSPKLGGR